MRTPHKVIVITAGLMAGSLSLFFQTSAWAEMIYGEISSSSPRTSSLRVKGQDPFTGRRQEMKITVPHDAEFRGVHSLEDLSQGDRVLIGATMNEVLGELEADTIQAAKNPENV